MIQKVNSSPVLRIVPEPRSAENDPGSSQGGGAAYEGPPGNPTPEQETPTHTAPPSEPNLQVVTVVEQAGMTEVVRELHENMKERDPHSGLSLRYHPSAGSTKGLLLNRKAE